MIHTFGDSHCQSGWAALPGVETHWMGAYTAYSVGKMGLEKLRVTVPPGNAAVFCFGEIDCRCHMNRYVTEGVMDIAVPLVERYFDTLRLNAELNPKVVFGVQTVNPAARKVQGIDNGLYPIRGTPEERQSYTAAFNTLYRHWCQRLGFVCVDVHDKYAAPDGLMSMGYSADGVHISNPVFIAEFLERLK
jgi:hypothetical protein